MRRGTRLVAWLAAVAVLIVPGVCAAQAVSDAERASLVRLHASRSPGGGPEDVDGLLRRAQDAADRDLPVAPIVNKIREGLAKRQPPALIDEAVQVIAANLDTASGLLGELDVARSDGAVTLLGESLYAGVTPEDVRDLHRQARGAGAAVTADDLAAAARGLAYIKDAGLPVADGAAVMTAALERGYRQFDLQDVGREVKRRERDYRRGDASLATLRDAIARGERPDRLFLDRPVAPERPTRVERPERPARPEPAPRPERPTRPERPAGVTPGR